MGVFASTRWSLVLLAGHGAEAEAAAALEHLCRLYWYPLYAYSRSLGDAPSDAEDFTQGFFAELIGKSLLQKASPERGKFRSFLIKSFTFFRSRQRALGAARKRGGGAAFLSFDEARAQARFEQESGRVFDPERRFEWNWALAVLEEARRKLGEEYAAAGKAEVFEQLQRLLQAPDNAPRYAELAEALRKSEAAIKMEVSRMRTAFRKCLHAAVADTVEEESQIQEEIHCLFRALAR